MTQHVDLDRLFQALADPTRRAIVSQLARGPATVSTLVVPVPMALPTLLAHVRVLEAAGLVRTEKAGRSRRCALAADGLAAGIDWLDGQRDLWSRRLDRFDAYMADLAGREEPTDA